MTRSQREADRLRATLWAHGINPVSNVSGSIVNTNPVAKATKGATHRGGKLGGGRRRDGGKQHHQQLDPHRQKKKLAPLSRLGVGSGIGSYGGGHNSSTASAAVIGFRNRDLDAQALPGWRHT